jgi:hypothetical protein
MKMARVGVLLDKHACARRWMYGLNVFERYIGEILSQAGIPFQWLDHIQDLPDCSFDIIIAALIDEGSESADYLWSFARQGGTVISYAGLNPLAAKLGFELAGVYGPGYAKMGQAYKKAEAVRFLTAQPWRVKPESNSHAAAQTGIIVKEKPDGVPLGPALLQFTIESGRLERWSVDIVGTIVRLQQGTEPVLTDGVPAADGTGPVNDNILKADDRTAVDWKWDRLHTETGSPYFAYPYADYWRELLIGQLLRLAVDKGMTLPFIGQWPDGIKQVALISHDSDINQDVHAEATLELLHECGVQSTWCMIEPGYSASVYDRVKEAGHELAFHYNALDSQGGKWDDTEFERQLAWLREAADVEKVYSNKNHYTRFEGWSELFGWCEKNGVESDQTRGPSKKGNVGFLFGTCHPYFPIAWANENNRLHDVVEIGFLTQDMDLSPVWADSSIIVPFLERVDSVEGVAHFLFHQVHIQSTESVRDAFRLVIKEARKRDFTFWTGQQINAWYRARRKLTVESISEDGSVKVSGKEYAANAVVWLPVTDSWTGDKGNLENRYGVNCIRQVLTRHASLSS